jgi:general secretion pathway protein C
MARYVSWVVNLGLVALSCWFVAQTVLLGVDAWFSPPPTGEALAAAQPPPGSGAAPDAQRILARNLFNASTLAPQTPIVDPEEELEATKLPLTLLGTAASDVPELSWAAIDESQQTRVVRPKDGLANGRATVVRIERRRVVLDEGGALRELNLAEEDGPAGAPAPLRAAARANPRRPARAPAPPVDATAVPAPSGRTPAQLFQDARILPKYTEGQMVGVQISSIKPGGVFEKMGLQDGDVITELNGIRIDSPEQSSKILLQLTSTEQFRLEVDRAGGSTTVDVDLSK